MRPFSGPEHTCTQLDVTGWECFPCKSEGVCTLLYVRMDEWKGEREAKRNGSWVVFRGWWRKRMDQSPRGWGTNEVAKATFYQRRLTLAPTLRSIQHHREFPDQTHPFTSPSYPLHTPRPSAPNPNHHRGAPSLSTSCSPPHRSPALPRL